MHLTLYIITIFCIIIHIKKDITNNYYWAQPTNEVERIPLHKYVVKGWFWFKSWFTYLQKETRISKHMDKDQSISLWVKYSSSLICCPFNLLKIIIFFKSMNYLLQPRSDPEWWLPLLRSPPQTWLGPLEGEGGVADSRGQLMDKQWNIKTPKKHRA